MLPQSAEAPFGRSSEATELSLFCGFSACTLDPTPDPTPGFRPFPYPIV